MRKRITQQPKKVTKQTQPKQVIRQSSKEYFEIERYFKDENTIKNSIASLSTLRDHTGWHIVEAYFTDTKKRLVDELLNLQPANDANLSFNVVRIQEQLKYIDYMINLPKFLMDSYREDIERSNLDKLDPYDQKE